MLILFSSHLFVTMTSDKSFLLPALVSKWRQCASSVPSSSSPNPDPNPSRSRRGRSGASGNMGCTDLISPAKKLLSLSATLAAFRAVLCGRRPSSNPPLPPPSAPPPPPPPSHPHAHSDVAAGRSTTDLSLRPCVTAFAPMAKGLSSEGSKASNKSETGTSNKPAMERPTFLSHFRPRQHAATKPSQANSMSLTKDDRRAASKKNARLIDRRCRLDRALQTEAAREPQSVSDSHREERDRLLAQNSKLERYEEKHLRNLIKARKESKRLYGRAATPQRAVNLDFTHDLLREFRRNLVPSVENREDLLRILESVPRATNDTCSSVSNSKSHDDCDASKPSERGLPTRGTKRETTSNDASLLDTDQPLLSVDAPSANPFRLLSPKRKLDQDLPLATSEKKKQKKTKSEQTHGLAQLMSPANLPTPDDSAASSLASSEGEDQAKAGPADDSALQTKQSQPTKPSKGIKADEVANKAKQKIGTLPTIEPWYVGHARAMMEPSFNDCVFDRRNKRSRAPFKSYNVSGALVIDSEQLTPPLSISSSSSETSKPSQGRRGQRHQNRDRHRHKKGRRSRGGR
ncbi:hypothetical protein BD289DRAFT_110943 [Coniella lustricola]|uniref:Something about silencing protein 4 domain-containing protein n=1 Tax=Coniella lustricola TaxID=2025994 RepID=A0A2T2ZXB1_9PEZI|nr:hypothetical protein BD289DRAFT_110943 [Coniella lustricola]